MSIENSFRNTLFWWDENYKNNKIAAMGGVTNHDLIELTYGLPNNAKILDLGCGDGRNVFHFASLGFDVTCVDMSEFGINKIKTIAKQKCYNNIKAYVDDIRNFPITEQYDLIMSYGVIDYLTPIEWKTLLNTIKEMTKPGGYNAYTCMIFNDDYPATPEFLTAGFKHCLEQNELGDFYKDWEVVRYDYYVKYDQHPTIPVHAHPLEKIIIRKPSELGKKPIVSKIPMKKELPRGFFDCIYFGMTPEKLKNLCGEPDYLDLFKTESLKLGVTSDDIVDKIDLELWYYGKSVIYIINNLVWGKSLYLRNYPEKVTFK